MTFRIEPPLEGHHKLAMVLMTGGFVFFILASAYVELRIQETSAQAWKTRQEARHGNR